MAINITEKSEYIFIYILFYILSEDKLCPPTYLGYGGEKFIGGDMPSATYIPSFLRILLIQ